MLLTNLACVSIGSLTSMLEVSGVLNLYTAIVSASFREFLEQ